MSGYLQRLLSRATDRLPTVVPLVTSRYATTPSALESIVYEAELPVDAVASSPGARDVVDRRDATHAPRTRASSDPTRDAQERPNGVASRAHVQPIDVDVDVDVDGAARDEKATVVDASRHDERPSARPIASEAEIASEAADTEAPRASTARRAPPADAHMARTTSETVSDASPTAPDVAPDADARRAVVSRPTYDATAPARAHVEQARPRPDEVVREMATPFVDVDPSDRGPVRVDARARSLAREARATHRADDPETSSEAPAIVRVHIGRLEVHAPQRPPSPPKTRPAPPRPGMTLAQYLNRRGSER